MNIFQKIAMTAVLGCSGFLMTAGGCCGPEKTMAPVLGTQSDNIWRRQEAGASASDFVVYQSEFVNNTDAVQLNAAGEDHLKSIAVRLHCGAPLPVIIEQSTTSVDPDTKYRYPIHRNSELDMKRREYVVKSLVALGITNADQCVVVSPALAEGYTLAEAARAYRKGLVGIGRGRSGYYDGAGGIGVAGGIR